MAESTHNTCEGLLGSLSIMLMVNWAQNCAVRSKNILRNVMTAASLWIRPARRLTSSTLQATLKLVCQTMCGIASSRDLTSTIT
jgi:hypothetical protein